jgi:predicted signal transduction protein with EAL and GGDEF domain
VLSGPNAWQGVKRMADHVLDKMSIPFRVDERTVLIGASIGLTHGVRGEVDADELLRRADVAMYAAKRAGKMRVCQFDARLDQRQARIHQIETELRQSLAKNDFRLVYQPLFDTIDGHVRCVEALLRWTSPTLGEVEPVDFIPVAEESGLIDPMGRFILRKACEDAREWHGVRVAVNVSAAQLRNPDFPVHVKTILDETDFPARRLELEITETYLISDPETAGQVMRGLHDLGVSIALDDFGTGYASIGFLRQFSFDKLKLDRSLVVDAENSDAARALLQASVAMARALDMEVAAEGVETTGQADLMRVAGCDQLQGWLFDKAMTPQDLERVMASQRLGFGAEPAASV